MFPSAQCCALTGVLFRIFISSWPLVPILIRYPFFPLFRHGIDVGDVSLIAVGNRQ
jgi:hypothetical protein